MTAAIGINDIQTSSLPEERKKVMPIEYLPNGKTLLLHYYKRPGKTSGTAVRKTIDSQDARTVSKAWAELVESVSGGSLKVRFKECVDHAVSDNNGAGMKSVYEAIKKRLGKIPVDERFVVHYQIYMDELKDRGLSDNTISNYKSCIQRSLNRAYINGMISEVPVRDFGIVRKFRSRIWTEDEKTRLYANMDADEGEYWRVYFAERNPIRRMDLANLRRENLVRIGPYAPYIRFQPRKTENVKPKPCVLSIIDSALLARFDDLESRFPDCPWLFPNVRKNKKAKVERWEYAGRTVKRFETICQDGEVSDFHFHDLKHVAITWMLKNGFTRDSLKRLGIQFSDRAIDVYDETGAFDELERIQSGQTVIDNNFIQKVAV